MNKIMFIILLCLLVGGCLSLGGKTKSSEIYDACANALKDTKIKGQIEIPLNGKVVTGQLNAGLFNNSTGIPNNNLTKTDTDQSLIMQLWRMFGLFFILNILITWLVTRWLGLAFINKSKLFLSVLITIFITLVWLVFIYFGLTSYNWFDMIVMNFIAWGVSTYAYDLIAGKRYKQLLGKKSE